MRFRDWIGAHAGQTVTADVASFNGRSSLTGILGPLRGNLLVLRSEDDRKESSWRVSHTIAVRSAAGPTVACAQSDSFAIDYDSPSDPVPHHDYCPVHDETPWRIGSWDGQLFPTLVRDDRSAFEGLMSPGAPRTCDCGQPAVISLQWYHPCGVWDRTVDVCQVCATREGPGERVQSGVKIGDTVGLVDVPARALTTPPIATGDAGVVTWVKYGPGDLWATYRVRFENGLELALSTGDGYRLRRA